MFGLLEFEYFLPYKFLSYEYVIESRAVDWKCDERS